MTFQDTKTSPAPHVPHCGCTAAGAAGEIFRPAGKRDGVHMGGDGPVNLLAVPQYIAAGTGALKICDTVLRAEYPGGIEPGFEELVIDIAAQDKVIAPLYQCQKTR